MTGLWVIIGIVVLLVLIFIGIYNSLGCAAEPGEECLVAD